MFNAQNKPFAEVLLIKTPDGDPEEDPTHGYPLSGAKQIMDVQDNLIIPSSSGFEFQPIVLFDGAGSKKGRWPIKAPADGPFADRPPANYMIAIYQIIFGRLCDHASIIR
jgi:hypothetical protein